MFDCESGFGNPLFSGRRVRRGCAISATLYIDGRDASIFGLREIKTRLLLMLAASLKLLVKEGRRGARGASF
jgi:hypothetical protein